MKGKVFINDEIFPSDGDYVIGGFTTDKIDDFNLADFKSNLSQRISKLIDDYIERAIVYNTELGSKNPLEDAQNDLAAVINDNLKISVPYTDKESLLKAILNSDKAQKWVLDIAENVKDYELTLAPVHKGIYNVAIEMDASSPEYMNAQYFTEESTLEQLIEQLSIIEL